MDSSLSKKTFYPIHYSGTIRRIWMLVQVSSGSHPHRDLIIRFLISGINKSESRPHVPNPWISDINEGPLEVSALTVTIDENPIGLGNQFMNAIRQIAEEEAVVDHIGNLLASLLIELDRTYRSNGHPEMFGWIYSEIRNVTMKAAIAQIGRENSLTDHGETSLSTDSSPCGQAFYKITR